MVRDYDGERRRRAIEAQRLLADADMPDMPDPISTPGERRGNGRKWWQEVWGKVTAGILLLVFSAIVVGAWAKAKEAVAATAELYALPPMVRDHELRLKAQEKRGDMTPDQIQQLASRLLEGIEKEKQRKAGH